MGDLFIEAIKVILIVLDASFFGELMLGCLIYNAKYDHTLAGWQSMLLGVLSIPICGIAAVLVVILIGKI